MLGLGCKGQNFHKSAQRPGSQRSLVQNMLGARLGAGADVFLPGLCFDTGILQKAKQKQAVFLVVRSAFLYRSEH